MPTKVYEATLDFEPGSLITLPYDFNTPVVVLIENLTPNQWVIAGYFEIWSRWILEFYDVYYGRTRAIYDKPTYIPKPVIDPFYLRYQPESWISRAKVTLWAVDDVV